MCIKWTGDAREPGVVQARATSVGFADVPTVEAALLVGVPTVVPTVEVVVVVQQP